jgi:indolepyruvate ferredoxin oxidoreductase
MLAFLKDPSGRPRKIRFGPWMRLPMSVLAKLKFLRGGALDPFGYSQERRRERAAIDQYKQRVESMLAKLEAGNRDRVAAALAYAEQIRGFGPVKEASFARAEKVYAEASQAV